MAQYDTNDLMYPAQDERFAAPADTLSLAACNAWLASAPPEPVKAPSEGYMPFVRRQTAWVQYRQAVQDQRDTLAVAEQQLHMPRTPCGEDVQAARDWIQRTGSTPLEFLARTYRDQSVDIKQRIIAAKTVMDYVHRKMPSQIEAEAIVADANGAARKYAEKLLSDVLALRQDAADGDKLDRQG